MTLSANYLKAKRGKRGIRRMRKQTKIKSVTNRKNRDPNLQKALKIVDAMWKDLSDQMACTQKSIANLRKDQKDADITKQMLDYVLFGANR